MSFQNAVIFLELQSSGCASNAGQINYQVKKKGTPLVKLVSFENMWNRLGAHKQLI